MSDEQPVTLSDVYALVTPQDSRRLYARWAATYESDFVALNQYVIPDPSRKCSQTPSGGLKGRSSTSAAGRVSSPWHSFDSPRRRASTG